MLWSLLKITIFVGLIAAATLGAGYLMETSGGIRLSVANTEFSLGPLQSVVAVLLLVLALWILFKLVGLLVAVLRFLKGDETALTRYFDRNRERKGYQALSDGLIALASGEGRLAMAKAEKAEKYLHRPELTNLLTAQAAEVAGDHARAQEVYKRLLQDDRTRFVGVRGIMKQRLAEGDTDTALKLAQKAFELKPRHNEVQDVLLKLQADDGDWAGARRTLDAKLKYGTLPRDVYKRRDAVLALATARNDSDADGVAGDAAIEANRLAPDLVPAAVLAAETYIKRSRPRYATKVLKTAWDVQPHPDLAAAFARIEPEETPARRIVRFRNLVKSNPDHPESRMLMAELLIADEDFPEARRALGDLVSSHPTARSLTIMAAIERGEGADDSVVRGWLTRALTAPRGPQWICDNCHHLHGAWTPVCGNCHAFDTLAWREPSTGEVAMPNSTEMLPLIVGRPDATPDNVPALSATERQPSVGASSVDTAKDTATAGDTNGATVDTPIAEEIVPPARPPSDLPQADTASSAANPDVATPQNASTGAEAGKADDDELPSSTIPAASPAATSESDSTDPTQDTVEGETPAHNGDKTAGRTVGMAMPRVMPDVEPPTRPHS